MFKSIIRIPDFVEIQTKDGWKRAEKKADKTTNTNIAISSDVGLPSWPI